MSDRQKLLKVKGLCIWCGDTPWRNGSPYCEIHRKIVNEKNKGKRKAFAKQGVCTVCGSPSWHPNRIYCEYHRNIANEKTKKRISLLLQDGLCVHCGKEPLWRPGAQRCFTCKIKYNEYSKINARNLRVKNIAKGLCVQCSTPIDRKSKTMCSRCHNMAFERTRKWKDLRKVNGLCLTCGKPAIVHGKAPACSMCWFKRIAGSTAKSSRKWKTIKLLLEKQNFKCAYTGEHLKIGINASLDHIIPIRKGGNHSPENLQWITCNINSMKNDNTHDEFLTIIKIIYNNIN